MMSAEKATLSAHDDLTKRQNYQQNPDQPALVAYGQYVVDAAELRLGGAEDNTVMDDAPGNRKALGSADGKTESKNFIDPNSPIKKGKRSRKNSGVNKRPKKTLPVTISKHLDKKGPKRQSHDTNVCFSSNTGNPKKKKKRESSLPIADKILWENSGISLGRKSPPLFDCQASPGVVFVSNWNNEVEVVTTEPANWTKNTVNIEGLSDVDHGSKAGNPGTRLIAPGIWLPEEVVNETSTMTDRAGGSQGFGTESFEALVLDSEVGSFRHRDGSCLPYNRKRLRLTNWTNEDLEKAMSDVREKGLSLRKAAALHGIPKSSLSDRLSGKKKASVTTLKSTKQAKCKDVKKSNVIYPRSFSNKAIVLGDYGDGSVHASIFSQQNEVVPEHGERLEEAGWNSVDKKKFIPAAEKESKLKKAERQRRGNRPRVPRKRERARVIAAKNTKSHDKQEAVNNELGNKQPKISNRLNCRITMSDDFGGAEVFKAKLKSWSHEDMDDAIKDVTERGLSIRQAAVAHKIPKSSLADRICRRKCIANFGRLIEQLRPATNREEDQQALKDLESGKKSPKSVAKQFGISFSFLRNTLSASRKRSSSISSSKNSHIEDEHRKQLSLGNTKVTQVSTCEGQRSKDSKIIKCRKERMRWKRDNLMLAINSVKEGRMSLRGAARFYGIPKSTLGDIIKGKCCGAERPGAKRLLTEDEERSLAGWLITMERSGRHVKIQEILEMVKAILDNSGRRAARLEDNLPKQSWWYGFLLRHKEVAEIRKHFKVDSPSFAEKENKPHKSKREPIRNRRKRLISLKGSSVESARKEDDMTSNEDQSGAVLCAICRNPFQDGDVEEIWISCGNVSDDGSVTDGCGGWSHLSCSTLAQSNLCTDELESVLWHCPNCTESSHPSMAI